MVGSVGGEGGIRTLDTTFGSYNGLANRRLQPLGHLTGVLSIRETIGCEKSDCPSDGPRNMLPRREKFAPAEHGAEERDLARSKRDRGSAICRRRQLS